ncbi:MAG: hypothetical protein A2312_00515 [Candidatus Staskawiczbacteria bacterium RIFOXYB2_FULL_32_9]|uniref:Glutamyl-tRNA amidotransferase n=1 Tax=Candidatus Staskawiczbacteria bacterium RIFOXYD1_FULL_32_13 TaxID=1802234 RepID=A0A1G2JPP2_9BACT|nr:MAG: hypothetical protein UR22_C0032G0007 [Parcubacteria group bacterium GW2011_GWC2_32_10]OGZ78102.1 MAG: hypothetical protein A2256_03815 [Candidatus Staskawiczbacteria bacterium RIFOXYA2_FULL_32_7]OGZ79455.1 MAG: hypothetical protein A2360_02480 [Candidatus Staskawiczbacteria bacterium RIFOXYB1_FULL_32_11]OGZ83162.1 MAG: hypothetical protein A2312_00515 [Candidatus Staskawiczbacteria bacterium RIFOXYB2_FULL_32_9]OGZ87236.1 MAG: hypothetical protein A2463_04710 [Candidatus Staskawiczbacter
MLKENIQSDMKNAMKSSHTFELGVLRMVLASFQAKEKEKRYKMSKDPVISLAQDGQEITEQELIKASELSEAEAIDVLSSEVKKRKDAILLYEKGGRPELAENEKKEIEVLQKYLPAQLSQDEIKKLVVESIASTGAKEIKDMGKIMANLNPKIKGKADGGQVSKIVKELLAK